MLLLFVAAAAVLTVEGFLGGGDVPTTVPTGLRRGRVLSSSAASIAEHAEYCAVLLESLRQEADLRNLPCAQLTSPSPLLPPHKVIKVVLGALQHAEMVDGFEVAFAFSERHPVDESKRSSWARGEARGRFDWDACDLENDGTVCAELTEPELFLGREDFGRELRLFFSTLLNHRETRFVGQPRWQQGDLVEFDMVVDLDGVTNLKARALLHKGGPRNDIWLVRGFTLLGELKAKKAPRRL